MEETFTTKSGQVLHLRPVKWLALWRILRKFGKDALNDPDKLLQVNGEQALDLADATDQLFNFCAGWGVSDDPPPDELDELIEMYLAGADKPHLARANWLRFVVLEDDDEIAELIGKVMILTVQTEEATRTKE